MEQVTSNNESNQSLIENPSIASKKSFLPLLLIILGIIELLFPALMLNIVIQLGSLYRELEISPNPALRAYILIGLFALFSLVEIIYGFILHRGQKSSELTLRQRRTAQALIFIGIVMFWLGMPLWVGAIFTPIYNLTSQF